MLGVSSSIGPAIPIPAELTSRSSRPGARCALRRGGGSRRRSQRPPSPGARRARRLPLRPSRSCGRRVSAGTPRRAACARSQARSPTNRPLPSAARSTGPSLQSQEGAGNGALELGRGGLVRLLLSPLNGGGASRPRFLPSMGGARRVDPDVTRGTLTNLVDERLTDPYISRFNPGEGCLGHRNRSRQADRPRFLRRLCREVPGRAARGAAQGFVPVEAENLLVGLAPADDAAVYRSTTSARSSSRSTSFRPSSTTPATTARSPRRTR